MKDAPGKSGCVSVLDVLCRRLTLSCLSLNCALIAQWGLSYTTFSYEWAAGQACGSGLPAVMDTHTVAAHPPRFCVTVRNTGSRHGDVVVLAFIRRSPSNATAASLASATGDGTGAHDLFPLQRLFGFSRQNGLAPGASVTVTIQAAAEFAAVVDMAGVRRLWGDKPSRPGSSGNLHSLEPALKSEGFKYTVSVGDLISPARHAFTLQGSPVLLEAYPQD